MNDCKYNKVSDNEKLAININKIIISDIKQANNTRFIACVANKLEDAEAANNQLFQVFENHGLKCLNIYHDPYIDTDFSVESGICCDTLHVKTLNLLSSNEHNIFELFKYHYDVCIMNIQYSKQKEDIINLFDSIVLISNVAKDNRFTINKIIKAIKVNILGIIIK